MKSSWELRIKRASELIEKNPAVADLLRFYQQLAQFQKSVFEKLNVTEDHDIAVLLPFFPELISVVKHDGSSQLKQAADSLSQASSGELLELINTVWHHEPDSKELAPEFLFFARAILQPYAEYLASRAATQAEGSPPICPFCGARPQVAVLRPEGDGGKRSLICSMCATEWTYRRLKCPNCGEENKDHLPVFVAQELDYIRVDACDTCHTYIKSIDMTKNGRAVPVVDEIATVSLNLWAQEKNYEKFGANLFGI
ncbi:MAG TPA: formate dehydrogenase accessory protein FdhE [Candidatus Limnocylindrales bacterium]|nr:formate dehydrogenase accessory protein FdhE [Candidatus Limnocylindrales bacterium]